MLRLVRVFSPRRTRGGSLQPRCYGADTTAPNAPVAPAPLSPDGGTVGALGQVTLIGSVPAGTELSPTTASIRFELASDATFSSVISATDKPRIATGQVALVLDTSRLSPGATSCSRVTSRKSSFAPVSSSVAALTIGSTAALVFTRTSPTPLASSTRCRQIPSRTVSQTERITRIYFAESLPGTARMLSSVGPG